MKALFDIPDKIMPTEKKAPAKKSGSNLSDRIDQIKALVETHLGKYREETLVIQDKDVLSDYIDKCISNGICGIDTETTGLDPLSDDIVGVGIYTPGEKTAYIPINHKSYMTGQRVKHQLSSDVVGLHLKRLADAGTDIDMFNAVFDKRFIKNHCGAILECTWDASLASRCLNENEPNKGLKKLHQKYILHGEEDAFKFDDLFKGINFAYIPIQTGALYAAHDPKITWEYAEYQREVFRTRENLKDVYWVFKNIEMPVVDVVADMEDNGVSFDLEYAEELHVKYHKILDEKMQNFIDAYHMYDDEIAEYDGKIRFDDPININSVPQLQALLYDIIGLKGPKDKKTGEPSRSTGEEILKKLDNPVVTAVLEYREFSTIVSTFIDKLPGCVNKKDGKIHCKFNQYGADTGRFSSSDPNMQNIPSHNKDIRKMFVASPGYVMMSADFSAQEPRCTTMLCQDERMIQAYTEGRDLYADIASASFHKPYKDCLEFFQNDDGTWQLDKNGERVTNPDGKERRDAAKRILLGINYGRGENSIAEQLGCSVNEARKIKESVFKNYPKLEEFERNSKEFAIEHGYVTTLWGRKRRLPVMQLPDYEFEWKEGASLSDDILDFDSDDEVEDEVPDELIDKWMRRLNNSWGSKRNHVIAQAEIEDSIKIIDNTKARSDATRQIVNSRVQGSAADMSKLAMIKLYNDERLRELGFKMLIPIHDEFIIECPKENAREVRERFSYIMAHCADDKFTIPMKCDVTVMERWYGDSVAI